MNATKRKFNALIQGMGTRTTPSSPDNPTKTATTSAETTSPVASMSQCTTTTATTVAGSRRLPQSTSEPSMLSARASIFIANDAAAAAAADATKRRRVGGGVGLDKPQQETTGIQPSKSTATTVSNVVLKKWVAPKDPNQAPRYCPGDREQLVRRLATFQELTDWTPKPEKVAEIEWAKRGWVCKGKERVQCTLCHRELVVKLNTKKVGEKEVKVLVPSEIEDALVEKYVELISTSHQEDCLWRKRGCDDSLLRLSLTDAPVALFTLHTRYTELITCQSFLPYEFNLRLPPTVDLDTTVNTHLPPDFFPPDAAPNKVALALALTGWQGLVHPKTGNPVPNSASCRTCLRRLGLWMFKSKEVDPETNTVITPAPMDHLDPVREHRQYCPWRNGAAQLNPGAAKRGRMGKNAEKELMAAWEVLATTVKNSALLRGGGKEKGLFGHRRGKSTVRSTRDGGEPGSPGTPARGRAETPGATGTEGGSRTEPVTPVTPADSLAAYGDWDEDGEREENAKDKERWARLRRMRSLFSTKDGKKLKRSQSRPGTGKTGNTTRPGTAKTTKTGGESRPVTRGAE